MMMEESRVGKDCVRSVTDRLAGVHVFVIPGLVLIEVLVLLLAEFVRNF